MIAAAKLTLIAVLFGRPAIETGFVSGPRQDGCRSDVKVLPLFPPLLFFRVNDALNKLRLLLLTTFRRGQKHLKDTKKASLDPMFPCYDDTIYSRLRLIQPRLIQPAGLTSHFDLVRIFMKRKKHFGYDSQPLITATLAWSRGGWFKRSLLYSYLSPLVQSVVYLRLDPGHPRRIDHGQRLDAQLGTGQRELNLRRNDLHGDLAVFLQALPHLVSTSP